MCKKKHRKVMSITKTAKRQQRKFHIHNTEELLHLMEIYLSEWEHRDSQFWSQAFMYFMAALTIIVLPFFKFWEGTDLFEKLPRAIFPFVGAIMSFFFLCIMFGYCERMRASHDIYSKLICRLPHQYRREKLNEPSTEKDKVGEKSDAPEICEASVKTSKRLIHFFATHSIMKIASIVMFSALILLGVVIGIFSIVVS